MKEVKQVLVMRRKFPTGNKNEQTKIRTGKMIAQGSHACSNVFFDKITKVEGTKITMEVTPEIIDWLFNQRRTKITVYVDTEEELLDVFQKAQAAKLPCTIITDAGLTEFGGVPTKTAVGIGPALAVEIDKITGSLPLL